MEQETTAKKEYEEHLADLRKVFLGNRYDNRLHLVFPTAKADIEIMETIIDGFHAMSVEFTEKFKTSLASS